MTALALIADDFADHDLPVKPGRLAALIEDSLATAVMHAPCLAGADLTDATAAAAKAILRAAVVRQAESGSGALQSETFGSHSYTLDNRQQRTGAFWPSEIAQLQALCAEPARAAHVGWLA